MHVDQWVKSRLLYNTRFEIGWASTITFSEYVLHVQA